MLFVTAQHWSSGCLPRTANLGALEAARVRRRRGPRRIGAVLSPEKDTKRGSNGNSSENGLLRKGLAFLKRSFDEDDAAHSNGNGNGNGNGSAIVIPPREPSGAEASQRTFFNLWNEGPATTEEAAQLRESLSPQAGGWDNWGADDMFSDEQAKTERERRDILPSKAFLGIGVQAAEAQPRSGDTWDPLWQYLSSSSEDGQSTWLSRPEWFPQFFDPFDRTSDMRRWIIPYVLVPYLVSQSVRIIFLEPLFEQQLEMRNPVFSLKAEQEEHIEKEVMHFKSHLQFEQLLGRSPPLTDSELQATLRKEALDLEKEERQHNCEALANFVTDTTFVVILVGNLLLQLDEAENLRRTLSKEFFSLDSSRQAFILLLVSDILVGYHSAEGWSTGLESVGHHYGLEEREDLIAIFVAIVPVAMDVLFKFWVFKYLRNYSPDTQVILEEIDRH